ncbi:MAG: MFS transporter [Planctomycetes bacterium]|nr:MFS transporter [Planctomycetota bacterium]
MSDRAYKWAVVAMLWLVCFFNYADRQSIYSLFPLLQKDPGLQLTSLQLGYVASSFMWVYAGAGWFAGLVGDRLRRKTVVLTGFLFWSVITLAFSFATKYWHVVALRAIEGFGEAFYFPAAMALISAYHGKDTRSRAMGIHQSSVYAGTVAGGTLGGWMGQHYGWRSSFSLLGVLGIVFGFVLFALLKEPPEPSPARDRPRETLGGILRTIGEVFRVPMVWVLMAVFVGANFVAMVFLVWLPKFLVEKFNMSLSMAGFSATAYLQVASVLGVLCGGILADRLARRYRGGRMMTQALGLFCGVLFIFVVGWTRQVPLLIAAMACFGFFKGLYDSNIWASLHDVVPPERRATAVGVINSIGWLGGGAATVTIAVASQRFGMSACISATSLIYLFLAFFLAWGIARFVSGRAMPTPSPDRRVSTAE